MIDTLLHELVHMRHDDHDAAFYDLNRSITREYHRLSASHVLGGRSSSVVPPEPAGASLFGSDRTDRLMAETALRSGQALGGARPAAVGDARSAAVLAAEAAEARFAAAEAAATAGCRCGHAPDAPYPATGAAVAVADDVSRGGGDKDGGSAAVSPKLLQRVA